METRSRKRKQYTIPPNPYARIFIQRRKTPINNDRSSVKDLRSRRVFSPSISDVKGSIEVSQDDKKGVDINVGFDNDVQEVEEKTEIDEKMEKSNLGSGQEFEIDSGVSQKDKNVGEKSEIEIGGSREDESAQIITPDSEMVGKLDRKVESDCDKTPRNERGFQKSSSVGEGGRDEQPKSKGKSGVLASCSRSKLYKNPSSFSYRRLLPFLMDITRDNSNVLETHPCQKVDKPVEDRPLPSSLASPDIHIDITKNEVCPKEHPFGNSNISSGSSNALCSNMKSPEHPFTEFTNIKTTKTTVLSTVNCSLIKEQPPLYGETASHFPEVMRDKSFKSHDASSFINEANPPLNLPVSLVIPESSSIEESEQHNKGCPENNGNIEIENDYGEWIQSTPPDSDVFCKPEPDMRKDASFETPSNIRSVCAKNRCANEGEKDRQLNTKEKLGVLVPCSRMKLYKAPNSFSYRRLLPFLKDLANNDTDNEGIPQCPEVHKTVNEVSPSLFLESQEVLKDGHNEVLIDGHLLGGSDDFPNLESTVKTSHTGSTNVDCSNLEPIEVPVVGVTIQDSIVQSVIQEPPETSVGFVGNGSVNTEPSHMHVEFALQDKNEMLDKSKKVEPSHGATCTVQEPNLMIKSSPSCAINEPPTEKDDASRAAPLLPKAVAGCSILVQKSGIDVKSPGVLCLTQDPFDIEPLGPSEKLVSGSSSGILKRHRRGCRGICTCLNCASFRLHAERAFEFSRNQMEDTEEVAMGLVKELSHIRTLLEKSIDGAKCHAIIQVPQVQEACEKALRAEELAKGHLSQMNQELNVHCRTPCLERPRVRFAENSEMLTAHKLEVSSKYLSFR